VEGEGKERGFTGYCVMLYNNHSKAKFNRGYVRAQQELTGIYHEEAADTP
jgi:hypothetical protein